MITGRAHADTTKKMSWDNVNSWSQVLVVAGAVVALVSGLFVSARQAKELAVLKNSIAAQEGQNIKLQTAFDEQREKTANAEKAVIELRKQALDPRNISQELKARLLDILSKGAKGNVSVAVAEANSFEPRFFAEQLEGLLKASGWTILESTNILGFKEQYRTLPAFAGTMVIYGYDPKAQPESGIMFPPHVYVLYGAFRNLESECGRFNFTGGGMPDLGVNDVMIIVGPKN